MTVNHAVWPEGQPERATHTASWWRAHWVKLVLQVDYMIRLREARRVRHALSDEGVPDPHGIERRLEERGAIPPPGGWPKHREGDEGAKDGMQTIDVRVVTHSVV